MAGRILAVLVLGGIALASALGLWVIGGGGKGLFAPDLRGEFRVSDFPLPTGFGLDPEEVAVYLAEEMQERADDDVALRLALGSDGQQRLKDIAIPRLLNVVVVRDMMKEVRPLANVLATGQFRRALRGQVEWLGTAPASDVALTVPGLVLAESGGQPLEIVTTSTGLTAVELGELAPGAVVDLTLWTGADQLLDAEGHVVPLAKSVKLGAAGDERGRVLLAGDAGWAGAALEELTWARWIVTGLLAAGLLFGLVGLVLPLFHWRKAAFRNTLQGVR